MLKKSALIFGYNKYGFEIAQNITSRYNSVQLYTQDKENNHHKDFEVEQFDLSDDWSAVEQSIDIENSIAFCTLSDNAQNIFLTISLRANFKNLTIISIASNKENANKLTMAGANKVIPIVESTSDIITNILELPISNNVLQSILFEETDLKVTQVKITKNSTLVGQEIQSIDWDAYENIIVLSLMYEDMSSEFIYATNIQEHILQSGDTIVVVGHGTDLDNFKKLIGV